jgi:SAM-dependent methyltransferase
MARKRLSGALDSPISLGVHATKGFGDTAQPLPALAPYALALSDFHAGVEKATLTLWSNLGEVDELPATLFFRRRADFFPFETYALELCHGRTLDAGAGTGIHSLELQARRIEVTALEILPELIEIQRVLGVRRRLQADFRVWSGDCFDTVLMLMNGIGPVGTLTGLDSFLAHAHRLVRPGGQLLVDSGEAIVVGEPDPRDAARWPPTEAGYTGEAWIELEYRGLRGAPFRELYVDMSTFAARAERAAWSFDVVFEGEAGSYLARLTPLESGGGGGA